MPHVIGIMVYRVPVKGFQVVDDGHPVNECLTGVVGQRSIHHTYHHYQSDEQAKNGFLFCFHRILGRFITGNMEIVTQINNSVKVHVHCSIYKNTFFFYPLYKNRNKIHHIGYIYLHFYRSHFIRTFAP
ncbi:hypothetical protein, partial [Phocaeicola coprocola]|uniref:hypothetical protein n=1 Tax=Phocaeicola coprocola TaxID=310298 RepID=UPI003F802B88